GDGIKEARARSASNHARIEDDARRRRSKKRRRSGSRPDGGGRADVHAIESAGGTRGAIDPEAGHNGEPTPVGAAIGVDSYGDRILVDSHAAGCKRADRIGGQGCEINGSNRVRTGVGHDREICFLIDGHAARSSAYSYSQGFAGRVGNRNGVYQVQNGDRIRAVVGDNSDARSAGGLPVVSKRGEKGDAGGRDAGGGGLYRLGENAGRIQAENRNLAAARAGVGDDREIIDFVDGDATRRGGRA